MSEQIKVSLKLSLVSDQNPMIAKQLVAGCLHA
jgi:hypothetical protein